MPTALPAAVAFTDASVTEGAFKTALTSMRTYLSELLGTNATGQIESPVGAVGAPGISFSGDLANGFYLPAANQIGVATAGVRRMLFGSGTTITIDADLLFTDATYDVGKSGATRPRDLFISRDATVGGDLTINGGDVIGAAGTINLFNSAVTTLNIGGAATTLAIGAAASVTTWTGRSITLTGANTTNNTTLAITNSSNGATANHAIVDISVGGTTSTGDPQTRWTIPGGTSWYAGVDNSASDVFIIGVGTAVGTTPVLQFEVSTAKAAVLGGTTAPATTTGLALQHTALTGVSQYGFYEAVTVSSAGTSGGIGFMSTMQTAAAAFT